MYMASSSKRIRLVSTVGLLGALSLMTALIAYAQTPASLPNTPGSPTVGAPTATLTANPATIFTGQSATLTWSSTKASSCTGTNFSTGGVTSGSVSVSPSATTAYSVSCTGPGGTANANATVTVSAQSGVIRINSAATSAYTDVAGNVWLADQYFVAGSGGVVNRGAVAIANTEDDRIYQLERWCLSGYNIPVSNGSYTVRMHFAETSLDTVTGVGGRIFNVSLEGVPVLTNFDVYAATGGHNIAHVRTFDTTVSDGALNIGFTQQTNCPMINGVEIVPSTPVPSTPTATLAANPTTVSNGESTTLSWSSTNATSCTGSGFSTNGASSGAASVSPSATTAYSISCSGTGGTASAQATVQVTTSPPPSTPIIIGESTILPYADGGNGNLVLAQYAVLGQAATLQSLSFYAASAAGNMRLGVYDATGPSGGPGALLAQTASFAPTAGWNTKNVITPVALPAGTYWLAYFPSSYSLTFFAGSASQNSRFFEVPYGSMPATFSTSPSQVDVNWSLYATLTPGGGSTPSPTATLSASPTSVAPGQSATLSWSSTNSTSCTGTGFSTGGALSGSISVTPSQTTSYTVLCSNSVGSANSSATVAVSASTKFMAGDRVETTDVLSVRSTPSISGTLLGTQSTGSWGTVVGGPTLADGFWWWQIDYDNAPDGWSAEDFLNKVTTPLPTVTITASPSSILSGQSTTLTWSSTNAPSCMGGGFSTSGLAAGSLVVSPSQTSTYTISCTGPGGTVSNQTVVTVTPAPAPTATITANPSSIGAGDSAIVAWFSGDAASCTGTNFSTGGATSGSVTVTPSATTEYSVSCTGPGGTVANVTTLTVVVPATLPTLDLSLQGGLSGILSWTSANTLSCTASDDWTGTRPTSGTHNFTIPSSGSFTLNCTGDGGSVSRTFTITSSVNTDTTPLASSKFVAGQTITATDAINVRSSALLSATKLGTQPQSAIGTVVGGPVEADGYWWWNIDWANAPDGWSVENWLE